MNAMKWEEIKQSIIDDLMSRELKQPKIRISALKNVEMIMREHFMSYIKNPNELKHIEKHKFKCDIADKKERDLNCAECSVINEIYRRVHYPKSTNQTLN
jgi:hypothetical protein